MKIAFRIDGAEELMKNLDTLGLRVQKNVVRRAIREAQKPLLNRARSEARSLGSEQDLDGVDMSEILAKNIVISAPKKQKWGSYSLHVQMREGVEEFVNPGTRSGRKTYIPAAIEYGHMAGETYVPAIPFLRRAAEETVQERIRVLSDAMRSGILREAIKGRISI